MEPAHKNRKEVPLVKQAFVTIGATAGFEALIAETLSPLVLQTFVKEGYTKLRLQVGALIDNFDTMRPKDGAAFGPEIEAFDFDRSGLGQEMRSCSGTILDAMRLGLPLIVVPNTSLLDNHQEELADELERQGYVTKSNIGGLAAAIEKAEKKKRESPKLWGGESKSVAAIVDDAVNYEIEQRSTLD
ncbi:UDP-N-acetylglucosamine transferase subunit alg13 protein [Rutstroemia sp. NJR-2017a WRK4]|nr:UDP-N-acetylglucosamine transferase subunit alg13 protein [Rutstroemia sp. NJR-2017a WRK4]